ncbi:hypothetical protein ASG25_09300 [Rhizobium sp. Leaf384]|uniref:hypothetical protein n=1 Tax=Rhizobium sp. Leaf384 TaxID=1736358 RepID=UPI0007126066|nr:hypothetical protein [Rhizobium sp. Leaf384]KQS78822.1 hypothetical protein ASG25_09300 [Rhizobium sp. Leaf384]
MTTDLHRISKYLPDPSEGVKDPDTRWYVGQLVFAGPDAAIEVVGCSVKGYVGGAASHPQGQLADMIDNYESSIVKGARELARLDTTKIVFAGKWHHVDNKRDPRFEAYLVHLVAADGNVVTQRYASDIFDWDDEGYNNGSDFFAVGRGTIADDAASLQGQAELKLEAGKFLAENGMCALEGIVWFPVDDPRVPVVYSYVNGIDAPTRVVEVASETGPANTFAHVGDGTLAGELRARRLALKTSPGTFRGEVVDRKTHRPAEMTLAEVFASTDAAGYWIQILNGDNEPSTAFRFHHDTNHDDEILKAVDGGADPWSYGNQYASDWQPLMRSMPNYRRRILAVGTTPSINRDPL